MALIRKVGSHERLWQGLGFIYNDLHAG